MIIEIKKFGTTLLSRESGRDAFKVMERGLRDLLENETLIVDFEGVRTFSPSWGDEILTPLFERYGEKHLLKNTQNLSVKTTIELLQEIKKISFTVV